jgi:hypothetical protein
MSVALRPDLSGPHPGTPEHPHENVPLGKSREPVCGYLLNSGSPRSYNFT